jgi:GDP/UDP-N,N'-diacetylbacillosamine 2-epimerase (hydrolysing)
MKRILFITSSRADYGLLRNVIIETKKNRKVKVFIFITGSHLSKNFGNTIKEIENDDLKVNIVKKKILKKKFDETDISEYISQTISLCSKIIKNIKPEKVVILGDRYELLGCAIASMSHRTPIAHLHGGEVTTGAIDDSIRHSISKLSHLHFPIHDEYKKRLIQLGENPKTIFNFGGLGAYSIKKTKLKSKKELEKILKINLNKKIFLITFHPTTLEKNKSKYQILNLLSALKKFKDTIYIFTSTNFDHENDIINREISNFVEKNKNAFFYPSLGHLNYISLMNITDVVIGNSSSGVLETPSFGVPTVNVGSRQDGRIMSKNIINSRYDKKTIAGKIKIALGMNKKKLKEIESPFYKKNTPQNISKKIILFKCNIKKFFFDLN